MPGGSTTHHPVFHLGGVPTREGVPFLKAAQTKGSESWRIEEDLALLE